jgi:hypothetical protein
MTIAFMYVLCLLLVYAVASACELHSLVTVSGWPSVLAKLL